MLVLCVCLAYLHVCKKYVSFSITLLRCKPLAKLNFILDIRMRVLKHANYNINSTINSVWIFTSLFIVKLCHMFWKIDQTLVV